MARVLPANLSLLPVWYTYAVLDVGAYAALSWFKVRREQGRHMHH